MSSMVLERRSDMKKILFVILLLLFVGCGEYAGQTMMRQGAKMTGEKGVIGLQGQVVLPCRFVEANADAGLDAETGERRMIPVMAFMPATIFGEDGKHYTLHPAVEYIEECLSTTAGLEVKFHGTPQTEGAVILKLGYIKKK